MSDVQLQRAGELVRAGQLAQAEPILRRLACKPGAGAGVLIALAELLRRRGHLEPARHFAGQAAARAKGVEEWHGAGRALDALGDLDGAISAFARALEADPAHAASLNALGLMLLRRDEVERAIACFERGAAAGPDVPVIRANLAWALSLGWRLEEAAGLLAGAMARWPGEVELLRLGAFLSNYADRSPADARAAHAALGSRIEEMAAPLREALGPPPLPAGLAGRALRVGLLSPDLREHPVACFVEPLLGGRDASRMHVTCYACSSHADATTSRLRGLADGWRDVSELDDMAAARAIRGDGIDVLLDLAGHTGGARPGLVAARAVRVQGTYLGYPATSGMASVDVRLVDSTTDPAGSEGQCTERLVRLDPCFLAYGPKEAARRVGPRGAPAPGAPVTFGCFGTLRKLTPRWLGVWARVLARVGGSRLRLKNSGVKDGATASRVLAAFAAAGVDASRVEILAPTPDAEGHFRAYHEVDIALDTHPYNGTTTTCDALWMGVPVVAMLGDRHVSRVSASLLRAAGVGELVARDEDEFVRQAVDLAGDAPRRTRYHATLRDGMRHGPLGDAPGLGRRVEAVLRGAF